MDDLISREALLTVPNVRKVTEYDETGTGMTYLAVPVEAIKKAPAVDAEPVMDDLISRKALLEELQKAYDIAHRIFQNQNSPESQECCKLQLRTLRSVIEDVKEAPTIDAVEVVRCEECRRGFTDKSTMEGHVYCVNWGQIVKDNGFCYMAQKEDRPPVVFRKYKPFEPGEVVTAEMDWLKVGDPNIKAVAMAIRETMEKHKSSDSGGNE